jgi:general secretion pathway protein K
VSPLKPLGNNRGIALLVAIFCVILISFLATEVSFDATSEYLIAAEEVKRVQAYYAAKAGVQISLLRINIYQQIKQQFGEQAKAAGVDGVLEQIWQMPFVWPPVLPEEMSRVDKDMINTTVGESLMEGQYRSDISSEASKLDLNDLVSPSKSLAENTRKQLIRLLENWRNTDNNLSEGRTELNPEELVNNIIDWMDKDSEGRNTGDEKMAYRDLGSDSVPPNQPLKTIEELHMIDGMTDELYTYLNPLVTVYGIKGIQVNQASADVLRSIDPQITEENVKLIIKRREDKNLGGPYRDEKDFLGYISSSEVGIDVNRFNQEKIPLLFDSVHNFKIKSIGMAGSSSRPTTREIIAIVYDFDRVKDRLGKIVAEDKAKESPTPVPSAPPAGTVTPSPSPSPAPSQRTAPSIVYWIEN